MTLAHLLLVLAAGAGAGFVNAVVGSGTLITFPTLVALGYPPLIANVSNTVGLVPGALAGSWGYRRELRGQGAVLVRLAAASAAGGLTGGLVLLVAPSSVFDAVVPVLLVLATILVIVQPWLRRRVERRRPQGEPVWPALLTAMFLAGVYGGYFGAAQGVIVIGVLGTMLAEPLQRVNAAKNVLTGLVNGVSGLLFVIVADVDWAVAGTIAAGSFVGAALGASLGRRLPAQALRAFVVLMGIVATAVLLMD